MPLKGILGSWLLSVRCHLLPYWLISCWLFLSWGFALYPMLVSTSLCTLNLQSSCLCLPNIGIQARVIRPNLFKFWTQLKLLPISLLRPGSILCLGPESQQEQARLEGRFPHGFRLQTLGLARSWLTLSWDPAGAVKDLQLFTWRGQRLLREGGGLRAPRIRHCSRGSHI